MMLKEILESWKPIPGTREFNNYKSWRNAVMKLDPRAKFTGDSDINSAFKKGEYDADWDGVKGEIRPHKIKESIQGFIGSFDIETFESDGSIKEAEKNIKKYLKKLIGVDIKDLIIKVKNNKLEVSAGNIKHSPKMFKMLTIESGLSNVYKNEGFWSVNLQYKYEKYTKGLNGLNIYDICNLWILPNGKISQSKDW